MEYQFTLFDQWATKISFATKELPEPEQWEKQLLHAKKKVIRHFNQIGSQISDEASLKLYINHHYLSLLKLIEELYFVKDLYKQRLLQTLESIKFYFDVTFAEIIVQREDTKLMTTLSIEEFAFVVNTLIECDVLKVRSKKALAMSISKYIRFVGHKESSISAENFYNALYMTKAITLNKVLKIIAKVQMQMNRVLKYA